MPVVTEVFNIAANDFGAKKSVHYSWVLLVTELIVSGIQCRRNFLSWYVNASIKSVTTCTVLCEKFPFSHVETGTSAFPFVIFNMKLITVHTVRKNHEQACNPVGCVPAAH